MTDKRVEAAKLALARLRAAEAGGCFNPVDDTQGECADGDCYCTRWCENAAQAALAEADAAVADDAREMVERLRHYAKGIGTSLIYRQDMTRSADLIERMAGVKGE